MRTTNIHLTKAEILELNDAAGGRSDNVNEAFAYLSLWAVDDPRYAHVIITGGMDGEILASYRPAKNEPITYTIGAVWHGDHYGFHS